MIMGVYMNYVKKLSLVPIFVLTLFLFFVLVKPFLGSTEILFSTNLESLIQLLILSLLLTLSSLFIIIFIALSQDIKITLPVLFLTALLPLLVIPTFAGILISVATLISFGFIYPLTTNVLKSYITFEPSKLFSSMIKNLTTFLIISVSIGFFYTSKAAIEQNGFTIPDNLIDQALKLSPQLLDESPQFQLPTEQISLLKDNPKLLQQSGLNPNFLNSFTKSDPNEILKETLKIQFQQMIKPYLNFLPIILTFVFYSILAFGAWILSFFISPILWLLFYLMEKTGYVKFTTETRQIKKLVI